MSESDVNTAGNSPVGKETSEDSLNVNQEEKKTNPEHEDVTLTPPEKATPTDASASQVKQKIDVLLKPAGDAPIMKKKKWAVDRTKRISWVSEFIRKYIKLNSSESLFLYVNQSFAPSPDAECGILFDSFGSDGKLVLHYCRTQAWG